MKIVFQSYLTQKKISDPLPLHVWTSILTLSPLSSLLSLFPRKNPLIQLRLTRPPPRLCHQRTIPQMLSQTPLLHPQLDCSSQFRCLKLTNLKLQKNFLQFTRFYLTFDPFYPNPTTSNFNLIILLLDVNSAVNITLTMHAESNDPGLINNYNFVSDQSSAKGK